MKHPRHFGSTTPPSTSPGHQQHSTTRAAHTPPEPLVRALETYQPLWPEWFASLNPDPRLPNNRPAYASFGRRWRVPNTGAADAEWVALSLGLKPALRETLAPTEAPARIAQYRDQGWKVVSFNAPSPRLASGPASIPNAAEPSAPGWVIVHIGPALPPVERAAEVNQQMLTRNHASRERELLAEHGALLGYPPCCVAHFCAQPSAHREWSALATAAQRTHRFHPLLNNLSLGLLHTIPFSPCAFDCPAALCWATRVFSSLTPNTQARLLSLLARPRLALATRHQLALQPGQDAWTTSQIGADCPDPWQDWLFFLEIARPLQTGATLHQSPSANNRLQLTLKHPSTAQSFECEQEAVWLPFGN